METPKAVNDSINIVEKEKAKLPKEVITTHTKDEMMQAFCQLRGKSHGIYRLVMHGDIGDIGKLTKELKRLPDGILIELDLSSTIGIISVEFLLINEDHLKGAD